MNSQLEKTLEAQTNALEASTVALWVCIALAIVSVIFALTRYGAIVQAQKAAQKKGKGKKQQQVGMAKVTQKQLAWAGVVAAIFFVLAIILLTISH